MNLEALKASVKKYPVGSCSLAISLIMLVALIVRYLDVETIQENHDKAAAEGQRLAANVSHASQLADQTQALEEANKVITSRLVNPSDLAINLQYFYKLEAETGIKLVDTRPVDSRGGAKAAVKGLYTPVQYIISLQGGYGKVLAFIRKLEHGTYFCRVISSNCSQAQAEQEKGTGEKGSSEMVMSLTVELLGKS